MDNVTAEAEKPDQSSAMVDDVPVSSFPGINRALALHRTVSVTGTDVLLGMFDSWYRAYFFGPKPKDLDDYSKYHAGTHTILPPGNGYPGPNTFHFAIVHPLGVACAVLGYLKVAGVF